MTCTDTCLKFRKKITTRSPYAGDNKRCPECAVYIVWSGLSCPCCHTRLRTSPKNKIRNDGDVQRI